MTTADWFYWAGVALLVAGCLTIRVRLGKFLYVVGLLNVGTAAVLYDHGARGLVPAILMAGVIALVLITPERIALWLHAPFGKKERENDAGEEVDEGQVDGVGSEEAPRGEDV